LNDVVDEDYNEVPKLRERLKDAILKESEDNEDGEFYSPDGY